ncbi:hypothetical protein E5352_00140 [Stenotrophomonas maltophilia]|uniref:Uncharacterized protein n=1 Tax=Stenotrophomonas maltophilia TaxID=40324 RepID=A0A4S2D6I5_STEMA|nr:hypothetical protein E5352_00140 [Stenotrophomonas maltophilia]
MPGADIRQWSCTTVESGANPRRSASQNSEFRFTRTLSTATILARRGFALDTAETVGNVAAKVDSAKTAVVFSITCCSATRPFANPSSTPIPARPRSVRSLSSYLLPSQQVRDGPACKQDCQVSIKNPHPPRCGFFRFRAPRFPPPPPPPPSEPPSAMTRHPAAARFTPTACAAGTCGRCDARAAASPDRPACP